MFCSAAIQHIRDSRHFQSNNSGISKTKQKSSFTCHCDISNTMKFGQKLQVIAVPGLPYINYAELKKIIDNPHNLEASKVTLTFKTRLLAELQDLSARFAETVLGTQAELNHIKDEFSQLFEGCECVNDEECNDFLFWRCPLPDVDETAQPQEFVEDSENEQDPVLSRVQSRPARSLLKKLVNLAAKVDHLRRCIAINSLVMINALRKHDSSLPHSLQFEVIFLPVFKFIVINVHK
jgi:hypothetical protein